MNRGVRAWATAIVAMLVTLLPGTAGCDPANDNADAVPTLRPQVVSTRPHDRDAFTEGLEIDGDLLYESTGLQGQSYVRASRLPSGEEIVRASLPPEFFGEGITRAGSVLWQLTWKNQVAIARDPTTLAEHRRVGYTGEGWGLCTRRDRLVMSNGSDTLTFRDPVTFAVTGSVRVTGRPGAQLNELDCAADGSVYANVWPTNHILHIDPASGHVLADIDATGLLSPADAIGVDVLNGIAQLPGTDHFLITGKRWPLMFEVRFAQQ